MGAINVVNEQARIVVGMADYPFVVASIEARIRDMVAAGVEVQGCFPERDGVDVDDPAVRAWADEMVARRAAQLEHGPEGPHWVGCGHAPSQGELRRQGF